MAEKFGHCDECKFWRALIPENASPHSPYVKGYGHCLKNAPSPCHENSTPHDAVPGLNRTKWPHTYGVHGGCWGWKKA